MYSDDSLCRSTKRGITRQNAKEPLLTSRTMAVNSYGNRLAAGGRSTCLAEGLFA